MIVRRQDATEFPVELSVCWFAAGNEMRTSLILRDITRRKETEEQLKQSQKLESIGQLAAGIAHEINTPSQFVADNTRFVKDSIQTLLSLVELQQRLLDAASGRALTSGELLVLQQAREDADFDYLVNEIPCSIDESLEGLNRIAVIVRSMKEFSHPDAEKMQLADLNRAIQSTVTVASNEWKYVAEVETDLDPQLPQIKCHLGALNQVVLNLVVNAAHAIAELVQNSGEKKRIRISTKALDNEIEIRVADDGSGIPAEIKERIFDPFFTTKEVGRGTGQGLALVHSVITKQHGGSIQVESPPGKGSCFTIRLPLDPAAGMMDLVP
jgi:signal transduction histidine kinase